MIASSNNKTIRRLGLDIGVGSVGFSLVDVFYDENRTIFKNIATNSIVFPAPELAVDRRQARSARRLHDRKGRQKQHIRNIFHKYGIADKDFVKTPTKYLNGLRIEDDAYNIREEALSRHLSRPEFVKAVYSITTKRGYSNQFEISENESDKAQKEQEKLNGAISRNLEEIKIKNFMLPSQLLTARRKEMETAGYQNFSVRNKSGDYQNSLNRSLVKQELETVVLSQKENKAIFADEDKCKAFLEEVKKVMLFQRPIKSFEDMVAYCSHYDKYHENRQKRMPLSSMYNIELALRQALYNQIAADKKTGEVHTLSKDEIDEVVKRWITAPSANEVTFKNIFSKTSLRKLELLQKGSSDKVLDIKGFRSISDVFKKYDLDCIDSDRELYEECCVILSYHKNVPIREKNITGAIARDFKGADGFVNDMARVLNIDGFASFSRKFAQEVLPKIRAGLTFSEALEEMGYYDKYLNMPAYDYLPPLNPTKADIEWLKAHIPYFDTRHLYYKPTVSKSVQRIVAVLRKLVNDIIQRFGPIDEIILEGSKELNSKAEQEAIKKSQKEDLKRNREAENLLKAKGIEDYKKKSKVRRAKMFIEQNSKCLYSGEPITLREVLDEEKCEVEHFIPRSHIWIDSQKNKFLVLKKHNQNKTNESPVNYLKRIGRWEAFRAAVQNSKMRENKKEWLTNEEKIAAIVSKDESMFLANYLNDTRSATKTIKNYLEHYLFPKKNRYGKDENVHVRTVNAKAVNELKRIWGIGELIASEDTGKKDRSTNYHHSIDALAAALCDSKAAFALHNYFRMKENRYKTAAMKEKAARNKPVSHDGKTLYTFTHELVEKYKNNEIYVCPVQKTKHLKRGFKDGNKKLVIVKSETGNEEVRELKKESILPHDILRKKVGMSIKDRSDDEVRKYIKELQSRLDPLKQKKIIDALEPYGERLIAMREEEKRLSERLSGLKDKQKASKEKADKELEALIKEAEKDWEHAAKNTNGCRCYFLTKKGKRQVVRNVNILSNSERTASTILIRQDSKKTIVKEFDIDVFKAAKKSTLPFVCKENDYTLSIDIYRSEKQQFIGLKYFRSLANDISPVFNTKGKKTDKVLDFSILKGEVVAVLDQNKKIRFLAVANGGGDVSKEANKIKLNPINEQSNTLIKTTLNSKNIIRKAEIDFYGNFKLL